MGRVHAILAEHNLEMSDIPKREEDELAEFVISAIGDWDKPGTYLRWEVKVCNGASQLNFCRYFMTATNKGWIHNIVGRKHNVEVAIMTYDYLRKTVKRLAREQAKHHNLAGSYSNRFQHSFCKGAAITLKQRCIALALERSKAATNVDGNSGSKNLPALASLYQKENALATQIIDDLGLEISDKPDRKTMVDAAGYNSGTAAGRTISLDQQIGSHAKHKQIRK